MLDSRQYSLFDPPPDDMPELLPTVNRRADDHNGNGRGSIDERFIDFHRDNPHVFAGIVKLALQMKRAGHAQWSTKAAFEVLRWQWAMRTHSSDGFKLANEYTAPYARLIMAQVPELAGFFVTKERRSGGDDFA